MNKHQAHDLKQMQSLPIEAKILMTKRRIRDWYEHWDGMVYVSFSGGKDSTVLKHIVDNTPGVHDVPAVFVNTGLEYPEIQRFVKDIKAGKYPCFNSNVEIVRPEMRFDEVLKNHGYPIITKRVSGYIKTARKHPDSKRAKWIRGEEWTKFVTGGKYTYLIDAPFPISDQCCNIMKKKPAKKYAKETGRKPITGQMAWESTSRENMWIKNGCNGFDLKEPISNPMSFWTEQDVLHYLKKYNVPYCSVYGDIVSVDGGGNKYELTAEDMKIFGLANLMPHLETTGCNRTGCIFCGFGCHLEKEPNRFQRLKVTHPKQYHYCIGGGGYAEIRIFDFNGDEIKLKHCTREQIEKWVDANRDNVRFKIEFEQWKPSKEGLGLGKVLDYIGVKYD